MSTINSKQMLLFFLIVQILFLFSSIFNIIIIKQFTGFIYLTFIFGYLLLISFMQSTKVANTLDTIELFLYSIGLGLFSIMLIGFVVNIVYPLLDIRHPLSKEIILITMFIITIPLNTIAIFKKDLKHTIDISKQNLKIALLFSFLPLLSIDGASFLRYYNTNTILIIVYSLIAFTSIFYIYLDDRDESIYPFIIWMLSLSLLFSIVFFKKYIIGGDAQVEYYFANLVKLNGIWNINIFDEKNSLLRIVILHPIYSTLLGIPLKDSFLIIHPIIYSFTPVSLYLAFRRMFNNKIAFYSVLLFMFMHVFFVKLSLNTRTGIAEFYLALIILLMAKENVQKKKLETLLIILFLYSIVVSHYGSSYFLMFALIIAYFLKRMNKINKDKILNQNLVVYYISVLFGWYIYTASSANYYIFTKFLKKVIEHLSNPASPKTSYTVYAISRKWVFSIEVTRDMLILNILLILVGILVIYKKILRRKIEYNISSSYFYLSISFLFLLLSTFLPTRGFAIGRAYHFCLCFLSPFAIIGFIKIAEYIFNQIKPKNTVNNKYSILLLATYLCIFLLFSSGVISETIVKDSDYSPNAILHKPRINEIKNPQYISTLYRYYETDQEFLASKWLSTKVVWIGKINIYLDAAAEVALYSQIGPRAVYVHVNNQSKVKRGYIFLRTYNLKYNIAIYHMLPWKAKRLLDIYPLNACDKIYTNNGSTIYYRPQYGL